MDENGIEHDDNKNSEISQKEKEKKYQKLAKSLAGHDKGKIYVVIRESEEYVYLVDGKNRVFDHPKKKNKKHIQIIYFNSKTSFFFLSKEKEEKLIITDTYIKKVIKEYIQKTMHQQEC